MEESIELTVTSRDVIDPQDPVLDEIEKTYTESFPPGERRDFSIVRSFIRETPCFNVHVVFLDNVYAGFIIFWLLGEFIYAEHFAINPAFRNRGIGAHIMQAFQRLSDRSILIRF